MPSRVNATVELRIGDLDKAEKLSKPKTHYVVGGPRLEACQLYVAKTRSSSSWSPQCNILVFFPSLRPSGCFSRIPAP
jgi:hypothetical protein